MSEEVQVEEVVDKADEGSGSRIDNLEDALKELEKVRKEAAGRRVKSKEVEEKAQKWEEYVQAQKTELERLTETRESLAEQNANLQKDLLRNTVARETNLDPEDFEFLIGDTKEELVAKATKLNARRGESKTDFYSGNRGSRVTAPEEKTTQEIFADMWHSANTKSTFKDF